MRRVVLILPDILTPDDDPSALRQPLPALGRLAEEGQIFRVQDPPRVEAPEALWLGLNPGEGQMNQGPLTVSALGADPPERSIHFHLSLMSFQDGIAREVQAKIPEEDLAEILALSPRLNTSTLTFVKGFQADHGLVWEELGDLGTTPARELDGHTLDGQLPDGDGDRQLRRYIDDSINLLTEREFNLVRLEAGLPMLNLLWPWGHGTRVQVPNLVLRRGERAQVFSGSLRLSGLARLASYKHGDFSVVGNGMNAKLEELVKEICQRPEPAIAVFDPISRLRERGKIEEIHWLVSEIDRRLLQPVIESSELNATRLTVIAGPLALKWDSKVNNRNSLPFDERTLHEEKLATTQIWELTEAAVSLSETA